MPESGFAGILPGKNDHKHCVFLICARSGHNQAARYAGGS